MTTQVALVGNNFTVKPYSGISLLLLRGCQGSTLPCANVVNAVELRRAHQLWLHLPLLTRVKVMHELQSGDALTGASVLRHCRLAVRAEVGFEPVVREFLRGDEAWMLSPHEFSRDVRIHGLEALLGAVLIGMSHGDPVRPSLLEKLKKIAQGLFTSLDKDWKSALDQDVYRHQEALTAIAKHPDLSPLISRLSSVCSEGGVTDRRRWSDVQRNFLRTMNSITTLQRQLHLRNEMELEDKQKPMTLTQAVTAVIDKECTALNRRILRASRRRLFDPSLHVSPEEGVRLTALARAEYMQQQLPPSDTLAPDVRHQRVRSLINALCVSGQHLRALSLIPMNSPTRSGFNSTLEEVVADMVGYGSVAQIKRLIYSEKMVRWPMFLGPLFWFHLLCCCLTQCRGRTILRTWRRLCGRGPLP